jgi:DNA-binding NtrC family response regulator
MSLKLVVFRLKSSRVKAVDDWLHDFAFYLASKGWGAEAMEIRGGEQIADAPWLGLPFVLAGNAKEITEHLGRLSPVAKRIVADCAYFWLLTDGTGAPLATDLSHLSEERPVTLDWHLRSYEVIVSRLDTLGKFPRLAGLSRGLHRVRLEIERIAAGKKGPWTPTLVLGETGTGKEEVAHSLHAASGRSGAFAAVACGWFTEGMLQDQLFGHMKGAFNNASRDKKGLLEAHSQGTVFLDDLDAAITTITGALLRVMATPKGKPAKVYRIGEEDLKERETLAWLIFSTNANIPELIAKERLREDFIFRFGDRIIHLPPLCNRPADIPAIAHLLWQRLWEENSDRQRPLSPIVLQHLCAKETRWKGNVRALQALLSLTSSIANLPAHAHHSLRQIIDEILLRGPEYAHWVGIISSGIFGGGNLLADQVIRELHAGAEDKVLSEAQSALTLDAGAPLFAEALKKAKEERGRGNVIGQRLRLARIIAYVARKGEINIQLWFDLCKREDDPQAKPSPGTFANDLDLLVEKTAGKPPRLLMKKAEKAEKSDYHQMDVYVPVPGMFH